MTASTCETPGLAARRGLAERKGLAAAGIATVALTAPALAAETAEAEYTKDNCTGDRLCLWSDGGFANNWHRWSSLSSDQFYVNNNYLSTRWDNEDNLNDSVSAVWNNSNRWAMLFRNDTFGSNRICFPPGTAVRDLHVVKLESGQIQLIRSGASWGNRISSHKMYVNRPSDCDASGSTMVPAGQYGCSM